ncbi:MAG TPA: LysE family translocator [Gaiellaceae bacterium]|nr:LysE family translocator [Gaiellaceae bacterium]
MGDVAAFAAVAALIVVVPGPDMALVLRNGVSRGRRAAVATALGINAGLLVWALAAAFGIAAVLHASGMAFTALKLAGAAYLIWLGVHALRDAWRGAAGDTARSRSQPRQMSPFRQGLLSNLFNPKIALVYTTLVPQFVDRGGSEIAQTFVLAGFFIAMGLVWLTGYALLVAQAGALLQRPSVRRAVNAIAGTMLTALGVRLAFERR